MRAAWQHWPAWGAQQHVVAAESLRSQVRRLRLRPSLLSFWVGCAPVAPSVLPSLVPTVALSVVDPRAHHHHASFRATITPTSPALG